MRSSRIRERWDKGEPVLCAWCSIGSSYSAEMSGWSGVDCVTVDLQHGMMGVDTMIGMLQALSSTPATPLVRIPDQNNEALVMKALDAGAYGVIVPMIGSVEEATAFVAATRYPPRGTRSFGPARGLLYGGADYAKHADQILVRLAMIETLPGLRSVADICAVDGLDGVFVGPSDLGLALGKDADPDPTDPEVVAAIGQCVSAARRAGKHAGIFCPSGAVAARKIQQGLDFVVINSDANLLKASLATEARAAASWGSAS